MDDAVEEYTDLVRKRADLMRALESDPLDLRTVEERVGASRSTVNRGVRSLEDAGLARRVDGEYALTATGQVALAQFEAYRRQWRDLVDAEPVLAALPREGPLSVEAVAGAEAVAAPEEAPYRPAQRLQETVAGAGRLRAALPVLADPRQFRLLYEHVVTDGDPATLVVPPAVQSTVEEQFPRRLAAMVETDRFDLLVGEVPDVGIVIADGDVTGDASDDPGAIGTGESTPCAGRGDATATVVAYEAGSVAGLLVNDREAALRWAREQFDRVRGAADPARPVDPETPDGGVAVGTGDLRAELPVALEREGFVRLDRSFFADRPVADPPTAWRAGLDLTEVHAGYAVERTVDAASAAGTAGTRPPDEADGSADRIGGETGTPADSDPTESAATDPEAVDGGTVDPDAMASTAAVAGTGEAAADDGAVPAAGATGATGGTEGETTLTGRLLSALADGGHCALVGPPGSGKSTALKRVACEWYDEGRGPVFYREHGRGGRFRSVEELVAAARAADGHVLLAVEDAVRRDADRVFEAAARLADRPDVSVLVDARESEWADPAGDVETDGAGLRVVSMPAPTDREYERLIERLEQTTGVDLDVSPGELRAAVDHDGTPGGAEADGTGAGASPDANETARPGEFLLTLHRLATRADPLVDGATALDDDAARVCEAVADLGGRALDVGATAAALTAAGVEFGPGPLYAAALADDVEVGPDDDGAVGVDVDPAGVDPAGADGSTRADADGSAPAGSGPSGDRADPDGRSADPDGDGVDGGAGGADREGVRAAVDALEGRLLFGRTGGHADDGDGTGGSYRTAHESWAAAFLSALLDREGEAARDRLCRCLSAVLALADDADLRAAVRDRVKGPAPAVDRAAADPTRWADDAVERLLSVGRERARLSVLFGGEETTVALPAACESVDADDRARWLGEALVRGDHDDLARAAYERLPRPRHGDPDPDGSDHDGRDGRGGRAAVHRLVGLSRVAYSSGDPAESEEYARRALELAADLAAPRLVMEAAQRAGLAAEERSAFDRAEAHYERCLELARELGDRRQEGRTLGDLGAIATRRGDLETAREYQQRSLRIAREVGDRRGAANSLTQLGIAASNAGDFDAAEQHYRAALPVARELGDRTAETNCLIGLGTTAERRAKRGQGDDHYEAAEEYYRRARELARETGRDRTEATVLANLGNLAKARERFDLAERRYREAGEAFADVDDRRSEAMSVANVGGVARERGDLDRARRQYRRALETFESIGDRRGEATCLGALGEVAADAGDHERARRRLADAADAFEAVGSLRNCLDALDQLVEVERELADRDETAGDDAQDGDGTADRVRRHCDRALALIEESDLDLPERRESFRDRRPGDD